MNHMHQAGDVQKHLTDPTNQNSLFQVASQFNLLEMASPAMTPERGVDIYYNDPTQGQGSSDGPGEGVRPRICLWNPGKVLHAMSLPLGQPFIAIISFLLAIVKVGLYGHFFRPSTHLAVGDCPLSPDLGQTRDNISKPFKWTFQNGYI